MSTCQACGATDTETQRTAGSANERVCVDAQACVDRTLTAQAVARANTPRPWIKA